MSQSRRPNPLRAPTCQVCRSPNRALIEATRLAGASLDNVAERYDVKRDAIHRHMKNHVTEDMRAQLIADVPIKELAERASAEGLSLLDYFVVVRGILMQQMRLAAAVNDKNGTAILAGKLTECLREIARLTGELLRSAPVTNLNQTTIFVNSPLFADLQSMLIAKLRAHPEALGAVIDGLKELEARASAIPEPIQIEATAVHLPEPAHA